VTRPADRTARVPDLSHLAVTVLAVFVAGVLGTAARLLLDVAVPAHPAGMPVSTLVINTVGSLVLGVVVATMPAHSPEWLRAGVTTGLLGSFTTFSALTVATVELAGTGQLLSAAALVAISVLTGVAAAAAGIALGASLTRRRA
jgi:CrcB protein